MLTRCVSLLFWMMAAGTFLASGQTPILSSNSVCKFYGERGGGGGNYNKDEACTIPDVEHLDPSFHQGNFICCGGGATSPTSSKDIPAGLEVRVDGGYFWAVSNPKLSGATFSISTYCGPAASGGPGCNVKVEVIGHYSIIPAATSPLASISPPGANNVDQPDAKQTSKKSSDAGSDAKSSAISFQSISLDKILAFSFGVVFVAILLFIALFDKNPTPLAIFIYRVVLALAAAGIGAVIPGMIDVTVAPVIRAGGAIALFVIVYSFKPADLVAQNPPPRDPQV